MVKPNSCLEPSFLALDIIIGIVGGLILVLALIGHGAYHLSEESDDNVVLGAIISYVIGGVMLVMSLFGAYAVEKEKKWALILSSLGISLVCLICLWMSVQRAVLIPKLEEDTKALYKDKIPLDEADLNTQKALEDVQEKFECCGLEQGYQDWGETVPETCLCPDYAKNSSKCPGEDYKALDSSGLICRQAHLRHSLPCLIEEVLGHGGRSFPLLNRF
ncbi:hypothetical protein AAFF_G00323330 [Aldrovandia affinis]|uniref:Tetraspanin n=1 Tax=Aldrovandia affinis TaxID=143900 RepID=A0AAD7WQB0_9TELE|nr:hypothetical protein AAFF_G00323330 [Aldrovandia affinis]